MIIRSGSCLCGQVRYNVESDPIRIGLCHCMDCRKESGSAFAMFGIWPRHAFEASGEMRYFEGRGFCTSCGSRVFSEPEGAEVEIRVGSLDMAPTDVQPTYELWVKRRENWLAPLEGAEQFEEDRI
jgi:hypothetical protein